MNDDASRSTETLTFKRGQETTECDIPLTALVAREMAKMFPDSDVDWDAWKDEMKERGL